MDSTTIDYVDLASSVASYVSDIDVSYDSPDLKSKIFDAPKDSFLKVTKKIGSKVTIVDVVLVDDDFVKRAVLGD